MPQFISLLLFLGLFSLQGTYAQEKAKPVKSQIKNVVVFLNGAQVNREAQVSLSAGSQEIVLVGLSPYLDPQSIQLKADGKLSIKSLQFQVNNLEEQVQEEIKDLEAKLKTLRGNIQKQNDRLAIFQEEEKMLAANHKLSSPTVSLTPAQLEAALNFHRSRLTELKNQQFSIKQNLSERALEEKRIERQIQDRLAGKTPKTGEVKVKLDVPSSLNVTFKLGYSVKRASWTPNYDVRVSSLDQPLSLQYRANLRQSTGEDWKQVRLKLSNADLSQSGQKPSLATWRLPQSYQGADYDVRADSTGLITGRVLDYETGEALIGATVLIKESNQGTVTDQNGNFSLNSPYASVIEVQYIGYEAQEVSVSVGNFFDIYLKPDQAALQEVVIVSGDRSRQRAKKKELKVTPAPSNQPIPVSIQKNATSVAFDIEIPYTIPSDGKTYTVEIKDYQVPAQYSYTTVPKLDPDAFLSAQVVNWDQYELLPGPANLFLEGTFLGKSRIAPQQTEDTLTISLGRDKSLQIQREKSQAFRKKQSLGANQVVTRGWEIRVRNTKASALEIQVEDQYPISGDNSIEVELLESTQAQVDQERGLLLWKLNLEPGEEKLLRFAYKVKFPKRMHLELE